MIAILPPSPLYVSQLGKFEESDLTLEMVTAKSEYVTISNRSEKSIIGVSTSQSTVYKESMDPAKSSSDPGAERQCSKAVFMPHPGLLMC